MSNHHQKLTFKQWARVNKIPLIVLASVIVIGAAVITTTTLMNRNNSSDSSQTIAPSSSKEEVATIKLGYDKKSIEVVCSNSSDISFYYGDDLENLENDKPIVLELESSYKYVAPYNGPYVVVTTINGASYREKVEVTGNDVPMNLSSHIEDGLAYIDITRNNARTNYLYYTHGLEVGNTHADFIPLDTYQSSIEALGNGWHTFKTVATSEGDKVAVYYQTIKIEGMERPYVKTNNAIVAIYCYELNPSVKNLYYIKGEYTDDTSWNEVSYNRVAIQQNKEVSTEYFSNGTYTLQVKYSNSSISYYTFEVDKENAD